MKIIDKFKKKRLISKILIILTILFLGGCSILAAVRSINLNKEEKAVLNPLAQRLGIEPDWMAVRKYLYCDSLKPGMTKEQVEQASAEIGPYYDDVYNSDTDYKILLFKDHYLNVNLSPEDLFFENGRLKIWAASETYYGSRADCEGKNR
jgi:hypothetical protein